MQVSPYLNFNGNCEEAFKFYERCLGGKIGAMMRFRETPMAGQMTAEMQDKIVHTRLAVGEHVLMGSDASPDHYKPMQGSSVCLGVNDPAEAERVFHALAEGGTVQMPIQKTFWAARFGMLTDRFGTPWMVNCEQGA